MRRYRSSVCVNVSRTPSGPARAVTPAICYSPAEVRARTARERAERREAAAFVAAALAAASPGEAVAAALARR